MTASLAFAHPRPALSPRLAGPTSLLLPALVALSLAFVWPVILLLLESLADGHSLLSNYTAFFGSTGFLAILWRTIWIAALVAAICLFLGYPLAYLAATASPWPRNALLAVVAASMFISLVVRCYSWLAILDRGGLVNTVLATIGLPSLRFVAVHNLAGVLIGVTQFTLPFMVLAIYDVVRRIDPRLMQAAHSLGATPLRGFLTVYLPLSLPGIASGCVIVFITTLGYYIAPSILGGPQNMMLGEVLATAIRTTGDWGQGATIGTIMLALALGFYVCFQVFGNRSAGSWR